MTLLLIFSIVSLTSIYAAVGPFPFRSKASTLAICIAVAITAAYLLSLLRRHGNYRACSLSTVILAYVGIMAGVCISGGASVSVSTPVLIFPPVIAFFFGGIRWGTYTALATVIEIAVFAALEFAGFHFYNFVEPQVEVYNRVMNCLVCFFSVSGMAFIYEFTAIGLKRQRDREKAIVDRLAHTDALTGLANRPSFDAELRARIARYKATGSHFALCCIDLDGFKPINDRYGHDVGDEVLQAVSERLRQCLREADYLGRDGGDEFMLLFDGVKGGSQLEMMAARLSQSIAPPIPTRTGNVSVGASLGFAIFPDDGDSADALRRSADKAMYTAKRRGNSGIGFYGPELQTPNPSPV
jgi:diguanylate cyclase (GGDEF)-like protein